MVIDRVIADRFIDSYMDFLGTLVSAEEKHGKRPAQWLAIGRARYADDRSTLARYRAAHPEADSEMLDAIAELRLGRWVYLKDTRTYSVLVAEDGSAAYGVLGLTDRLRTVAQGATGSVLRAGLVSLQGRWVCDGLLEGMVWLGPNLRRELNQTYQNLRDEGRFSLGL
ncbi:hypothetical protein [Chitinimonas sp. BJB300]|uniref:hypothetical protein n=1 Tax=Chitinimonas sp. BJB300 TaxID=1559339 RepID=UPI000C0D2B19|nr:hypothetical protein [Chitinimonas sp. BJB300]PHV10964.1 hypothetical protein CSQ89_13465 [Chitinimonas sp. BJB300]TSJ89899.1 hypothetical protein FG002_006765 [Chitinimonas sp. BJB300]